MRRRHRRWASGSRGLLGALLAFGCNAMLGNDAGVLDDGASLAGAGGAAAPIGSGGTMDAAGAAGQPGTPEGGEPTGEAGMSSGAVAGAIGSGGTGGSSGAGAASGGRAGRGGTSGAPSSGGANGGTAGAPNTGCSIVPPACTGAMQQTDQQACGNCGTQTRTRTCQAASCTWGAWSAFSACTGQGECAPQATGTMSDRCPGQCGPRTQTRTCSNQCTWGAWTVTSSSCVACSDCGEVVYCDAPGERGTWCRQTSASCNDAEINADCAQALASVGCVRIEPYFLEHIGQ